MTQESEVIVFLIGLGCLLFIQINRLQLERLPKSGTLIKGFYLLLIGWLLTILEGYFWGDALNFLEHVSYAGSALLVAAWCWQVFGKGEDQG